MAAILDFTDVTPFRNESHGNASGVENCGYFALWPAVDHLGFIRKWDFKILHYANLIAHQSAKL